MTEKFDASPVAAADVSRATGTHRMAGESGARGENARSAGETVMRLRGISKAFDGTPVLRQMDLDVVAGETLVLLGENGAGKSTLKNIMTGLIRADSGSIEFKGDEQSEWTSKHAKSLGLAAIHQELSLFPNLSIAENVHITALGRGGIVRVRHLEQETNAMFRDLLDIEIDSSMLVGELPLGQRQLVEIVKAIRSASSVLVLDEPTTSLSIDERQLLFRAMRRLRSSGYALVHVTHFLEEIAEVGDRVAIMRDGVLVAVKAKNELSVAEIEQLMVGRELSAVTKTTDHEPSTASTALEVENLRDSLLLHDINFSVREGEIVGIAGLSGAGRSELMQSLIGLRPAAGTVRVFGEDFGKRTVGSATHKGMVLVSEDRRAEQAFLERTISENLTSAMLGRISNRIGWLSSAKERRLSETLVKDFGVKTPSVDSEFGSMSGGNQQKAILARWLTLDPRICLLDEPTKGIDVGAKADVQRTIFDLAARGVAVVVVSSDLPELFQVSDRILVMRGGTITAELARNDFDSAVVLRAASTGSV